MRVLTQAARLRAIVALAAEDQGGAVNLWQADQRSTALREVDRLARRAMGAATARLHGDGGRRYSEEGRCRREEPSRRLRDDRHRQGGEHREGGEHRQGEGRRHDEGEGRAV